MVARNVGSVDVFSCRCTGAATDTRLDIGKSNLGSSGMGYCYDYRSVVLCCCSSNWPVGMIQL